MNLPCTGFQFRQFHVGHDQCAMKVGTDGVLLGAWANAPAAGRILDVGTGSGIIALMLAQRYPIAFVSAVEIDANAARQAAENVRRSPWPDRIRVFNESFAKFCQRPENGAGRFHGIICNPPFFQAGTRSRDLSRRRARHDDQLSIDELMIGAARVLDEAGAAFVNRVRMPGRGLSVPGGRLRTPLAAADPGSAPGKPVRESPIAGVRPNTWRPGPGG